MFAWMLGFRTVAAAAAPFAFWVVVFVFFLGIGIIVVIIPRARSLGPFRGLEVFGSSEGLKSRALPRV